MKQNARAAVLAGVVCISILSLGATNPFKLSSNKGLKGRVELLEKENAELKKQVAELTMKMEGLIPALESSHAFVQAYKDAGQLSADQAIIINMSGRGDKDIFTIAHAFQDPSWKDFIDKKGKEYETD